MSENKERYQFSSPHDQLTIMRAPVERTRSVNGVMQIVMEDQVPFKFESGNLVVYSKADAEELRDHRHFNVKFIEVPTPVLKVADNQAKKASKNGEADSEPSEVKTTEVTGVSSFNEAVTYFKDEFGLEHKEVNSKDKINALTEKYAIVFPDYPIEEE